MCEQTGHTEEKNILSSLNHLLEIPLMRQELPEAGKQVMGTVKVMMRK